jgi:hypothetical protein
MPRKYLTVLCALTAAAATALPGTAHADPLPMLDLCALQAANATATLPYPGHFASSSGATNYGAQLCPRLTVNVAVAPTPLGHARIGARPDMNLNSATCPLLTMTVGVYKLVGGRYTREATGTFQGHWDGTFFPGCYLIQTGGDTVFSTLSGDASAEMEVASGTWRVTASAHIVAVQVPVTAYGWSAKYPQ